MQMMGIIFSVITAKIQLLKKQQNADLRLTCEPEKVYYPWELTRRFDYGYFPLAKEEIWDWFIVAECGDY